jgi:hypothetical protein
MALLDYLAGVGYVVFVTLLGLFLVPDPTGLAPVGVVIAGSLVAIHAVRVVKRPARVLAAGAAVTVALTLLVAFGFATVGAVLPAPTLLATVTLVVSGPVGYALVLGSGVGAGEPNSSADDATEV